MWSSSPFWQNSWKPWKFPVMSAKKGGSCYVNVATLITLWLEEWNFQYHPTPPHSSPQPPDLLGGERGWRQNSVTNGNDLLRYAYVMKPLWGPKGEGLENFQVGEPLEIWGSGALGQSVQARHPFPVLALRISSIWLLWGLENFQDGEPDGSVCCARPQTLWGQKLLCLGTCSVYLFTWLRFLSLVSFVMNQ